MASIDSNASKNVKIEGSLISVQVKEIMLDELVKEIKKRTGIEFDISESLLESEVSVNFKELTLLEGLKKVLYPLNYAIIYSPDDEISRVIVLDKGDGSTMMAYNRDSFVSPAGYQYSGSPGHNPPQLNEEQLMEEHNEQAHPGNSFFESHRIPETEKTLFKEEPDANATDENFPGTNAQIQATPVSEIAPIEGPAGIDAFIQQPPVTEIALIEGPQGIDIFVQEPPVSDTTQGEGPPGTNALIEAPPAPEITLIKGPQGADTVVQKPTATESAPDKGPQGIGLSNTQEEISAPPGE